MRKRGVKEPVAYEGKFNKKIQWKNEKTEREWKYMN